MRAILWSIAEASIRACTVLNSDFHTHKSFGQKVADGGENLCAG